MAFKPYPPKPTVTIVDEVSMPETNITKMSMTHKTVEAAA